MNPTTDDVDRESVLALFETVAERAGEVLAANDDWSRSGRRDSQYSIDVDVDAVCLEIVHGAGFAVLSEESGVTAADGSQLDVAPSRIVVVDPLDGSTNAALGLPWCATALCLVMDGVAEVALVRNLRTGDVFTALRGRGAHRNGRRLSVADPVALTDAIVAANARPPDGFGAQQFRCTGSTALDIAMVADRGFDASIDFDDGMIGVWDYLASILIVEEAGGVVADALGRDLLTLDHTARRRPVVATSSSLLGELLAVV